MEALEVAVMVGSLPKTSLTASNSSSSIICRICHESENWETLIAPCQCRGSIGFTHKTCLKYWITFSKSDKCEICNHKYNTKSEPRPWNNEASDKLMVRNLIAAIFGFLLLILILFVTIFLFSSEEQLNSLREHWESIGLVVLTLFLVAIYLSLVLLLYTFFILRSNQ